MKKIISLFAVLLLIFSYACFDDSEDGPTIIGTWEHQDYPYNDSGKFVFNENGSFTSDFHEGGTQTTSSGTYTFENNILTLNFTGSTNAGLIGTTETYTGVVLTIDTITVDGTLFHKK